MQHKSGLLMCILAGCILLLSEACSQPKDPEVAWSELSKQTTTFFQKGKYPEAVKAGRDALHFAQENFKKKDSDKEAISYFNLASAYFALKEYDTALPLFSKSLQATIQVNGANHSRVADILKAIAVIDIKQNRLSDAKENFQKALTVYVKLYGNNHPSILNILAQMAEINRRQCRMEEAVQLYRTALKLKPGQKTLQDNLEKTIADQKNIDSIKMVLQEALLTQTNNYQLEWRLGNCYKVSGSLDEALAHYQKALSIKADYFDALFDTAKIYAQKLEYGKSISAYKKALEVKPDRREIVYEITRNYSKANEIDNALKWLEQLVKTGFSDWKRLEADQDFQNLRSSAEYRKLIQGKKA